MTPGRKMKPKSTKTTRVKQSEAPYQTKACIASCFLHMFAVAIGGTAQRWKTHYVVLGALHTVSSVARHANQPRRKERSSAKCAAAGPSPALTACQLRPNVMLTSCLESGKEKK